MLLENELSPEDQRFFDIRKQRRTAQAKEIVAELFGEAHKKPQEPRQFSRQTLDAIKCTFIGMLTHLGARVDLAVHKVLSLEARIIELESSGLKFCGTWQRALGYRRGDVVTHGGSCWVAIRQNDGIKPGASDVWQLVAKRGRDAA